MNKALLAILLESVLLSTIVDVKIYWVSIFRNLKPYFSKPERVYKVIEVILRVLKVLLK